MIFNWSVNKINEENVNTPTTVITMSSDELNCKSKFFIPFILECNVNELRAAEAFLPTVALGDVVEFEILPPGTAAWFCTKDKYNLPMFSYVCQAETKA